MAGEHEDDEMNERGKKKTLFFVVSSSICVCAWMY
jgi:hypothetical protein